MSKEGANNNIKINTIAPVAATSMTQGVMSEDLLKAVHPKHVIPLVAVLASRECPETGGLFEVGGGWVTTLRYQRAEGVELPLDATPEMIKENWAKVVDFSSKSDYPTSGNDSIEKMYANFEKQLKKNSQSPKL